MQSDVSVLACSPQTTPLLIPHFMRALKKEHNHFSNGVKDGAHDIKTVLLSQLGNKPHELFSSSVPPEQHKIPLDSVDTLLRNKSLPENSTHTDSELTELFQFVSERSVYDNEKPVDAMSNSFWLPNTSPPAVVKDEEPQKPLKLPAVDQIMPFYPRSPSPSGILFPPLSPSSSSNGPAYEQPTATISSSSPLNYVSASLSPSQTLTPTFVASDISSTPSIIQPPQGKCDNDQAPSTTFPVQQRQWRFISVPTKPNSEQEQVARTPPSDQRLQPPQTPTHQRFILPNTSRPSFEVSISKQTILVPVTGGTGGGNSLLLLPLAVAAAFQQKQPQPAPSSATSTAPTPLPSGPAGNGGNASGLTQFLLIQTGEAGKAAPVNIIHPTKGDIGFPVIAASTETSIPTTPATTTASIAPAPVGVVRKAEAPTQVLPATRVPLPPVAAKSAVSILPPATEILPAPLFAKPSDKLRSSLTITDVTANCGTPTVRRRHQCPFCTKSCERKDNLQAHIRTHTGERPFPCRFCPKAFPQKDHLRAHIRTHTGEKPYRCLQCSKAFAQLGNLHRHVKTHRQ
ncbi:unnamed protein product [Mesocestoides corti]|uniref:C2H2-type domain-containing protein n=1 Tax=Mesocestoides corti TaxID=53468 RepID=A0A0R3UGA3_MESCO|nr:unnamed protein product [Mesocestoides corti]